MNTITHEQQIANQKAEIESLNRKIVSLEKELQKLVDPDTGEIRPTFQAPGLSANDALERRIYHAMHGLFLPVKVWDKHTQEDFESGLPWWALRELLFKDDLFAGRWEDPDFRKGVSILNDIVLVVDGNPHKRRAADLLERMEDHEFGYRLYARDKDDAQEMYRGVQSLITAVKVLRSNLSHPGVKNQVSDRELSDILVILNAVAFFQRVWIDAAPELVEEEQGSRLK